MKNKNHELLNIIGQWLKMEEYIILAMAEDIIPTSLVSQPQAIVRQESSVSQPQAIGQYIALMVRLRLA